MNLESKKKIPIELLQPGVFIELDGKWFNHPFFFNKFKVRNAHQIRILKESGIKEVLWVPEKSDCWPRDAHEPEKPEPLPAAAKEQDPAVERM